MIPFLLVPPAPFWLRVLASVAAPLFIFLSGMMVALSFRLKKHTFSYFLIRGGFVVLLGVLMAMFAVVRMLSKLGGAQRREAPPWLCGYVREADCHRYSAHNFYGEIKRYFRWLGGAPRPPGEQPSAKP